VIIEILIRPPDDVTFKRIFGLVRDEDMFISPVQTAELSDWCMKNGIDPKERISKVLRMANQVDLTEEICMEAARLKQRYRGKGAARFSLMDGLILASAMSLGDDLLTFDRVFRYCEGAVVLDR